MKTVFLNLSKALILTLLTIIMACKGGNVSEDSQGVVDIDVELDNGKRWKANKETTEGILKMQIIIEGSQKNQYNGGTCSSLKEELKTEFNLIFERCNMTGEAHEQLHNFLYPLMSMINGLDQGSVEECKNFSVRIGKHLSSYADFFE